MATLPAQLPVPGAQARQPRPGTQTWLFAAQSVVTKPPLPSQTCSTLPAHSIVPEAQGVPPAPPLPVLDVDAPPAPVLVDVAVVVDVASPPLPVTVLT